jgi:hypothetical protein
LFLSCLRLVTVPRRLTPMIDTYKRKISAAGYEDKVPEAVRMVNAEKLASYEAEMEATMNAFNTFNAIK